MEVTCPYIYTYRICVRYFSQVMVYHGKPNLRNLNGPEHSNLQLPTGSSSFSLVKWPWFDEYITFPDIPKDHIKLVVSNYIKLNQIISNYVPMCGFIPIISHIPLKYPHYIPLHSKTNPMEITIIFHFSSWGIKRWTYTYISMQFIKLVYPLVICYSLLLKIAIEFVDLPINSMMIFQFANC